MIWLFFVVTKNVILWRLYWVYIQLRMAYKHGALAPWRTWNKRGPLACMMHPPTPSSSSLGASSSATAMKQSLPLHLPLDSKTLYCCHEGAVEYCRGVVAKKLVKERKVAAIFIVKASFHPCSPPCLEDLTSWSAAISHCWSLAWPWSGEPQLHATGSPPLIASLVDSRQPDPCPPFSTMRPAHPDLLSYLHVWRNAWHQVAIFIILEFYLFYCFKDYYVIFVFYF